jgi:hypothetical protein
MNRIVTVVLGSAFLAAGAPTVARADLIFDFESFATGTVTALTLSGGGLTATLTRGGLSFSIINLSGIVSPSFGSRTLDPFSNTNSTPFLLNFSQGITGLSIDMGDFVPSDDDVLSLQLFSGLNGTGTLLGSSSIPQPGTGSGFPFLTPSVTGVTGAQSAVFIGGSSGFPNSVYYDNIRVTLNGTTTVPEPSTFALLVTGLVGVGFFARKRRFQI